MVCGKLTPDCGKMTSIELMRLARREEEARSHTDEP